MKKCHPVAKRKAINNTMASQPSWYFEVDRELAPHKILYRRGCRSKVGWCLKSRLELGYDALRIWMCRKCADIHPMLIIVKKGRFAKNRGHFLIGRRLASKLSVFCQ
ncbi:hypothetical protein DTL42_00780 [Bremerella cremea]|uniref:Uncharacterized protein n=1 Tax=Bremerella cremea TaxID=1031537 RepID=A0A368KXH7_9BACT|nr:hypothetical protein DTL42_00780 [Bremerella cremea]